ncbi:MqnA/MqnD/SBP family protein [Vibrio sp. CAU 1672]|uniref:ABC transporter substrate-binding protein n=1 Tax=Vibrio sp. CAU 1672 TaxID=3032594 RepID=UPI0023DCAC56|nr:MqnA/MqnD/SBP family protein [Vibrio sp. CAU 1672]MDF2153492.1 PhnD/SsuA/transferrin family substrate-binding protein [Vibrio sp. CAU 1672]
MKKIIFSIIVMLGAIVSLAAQGEEVHASDIKTHNLLKPVHIRMAALKGPTAFGMIRMIDQVESLGNRITLSYELVATPQDMVARISSGQVDIAAMPVNLAAKLYNKMGARGYAIGASVGDGVIYALTTSKENITWESFRGKTINSIAKGSTPDYLTQYVLNGRGLEEGKDVTLRFTYSHQQLAQMMAAGKVDNAILPEPLVTMVLTKNPQARIFADMQKEWGELSGTGRNYPISLAVVSPNITDKEALDAVFSAYEQSIEWVLNNPEKAASAIERQGIMPAAIALKAIPRCNLNFSKPAEIKKELELFYGALFKLDPESIGGKLPDDQFYLEY